MITYFTMEEGLAVPRPKGSKNKTKISKDLTLDELIAEESNRVASLEEEVKSVEEVISEQTAKLKTLKAELKKTAKNLQKYEEQKAQEAAIAAAAAAKEALQEKIDQLLENGLSLEDILEKLK